MPSDRSARVPRATSSRSSSPIMVSLVSLVSLVSRLGERGFGVPPRRAAAKLAPLLALASGCGEAPRDEASSAAAAPSPPACTAGRPLRSIAGRAVDEVGGPLTGALAQLCVREPDGAYCMAAKPTRPDGSFSLAPLAGRSCVASVAVRVTSTEAGRAGTYCRSEAPTAEVMLARPVQAPLARAPLALPPRGDEASAREVVFDGGLALTLAPEAVLLDGGGYEQLSATTVAPADAPCFDAGPRELGGLFAFAPQGYLAAPAAVRITSPTSLQPGTPVTLLALGGLACVDVDGQPIEEGVVAPVARAAVADDGVTIATLPGQGTRCLGWLGWSLAP